MLQVFIDQQRNSKVPLNPCNDRHGGTISNPAAELEIHMTSAASDWERSAPYSSSSPMNLLMDLQHAISTMLWSIYILALWLLSIRHFSCFQNGFPPAQRKVHCPGADTQILFVKRVSHFGINYYARQPFSHLSAQLFSYHYQPLSILTSVQFHF